MSAQSRRKKNGRPSGFRPAFARKAHKLMLLGLTIDELAPHFGVSVRTVKYWMSQYPRFLRAIKHAGEPADSEVAAALRHRAIGYSHPEEKVFCTKDGEIVTYDTIKHYPPDPIAAMMWLSNRQRARWKHQSNLDLTNSDGNFRMFAEAMREADRVLDAKFRVIEPLRLTDDDDASDSGAALLEAPPRKM